MRKQLSRVWSKHFDITSKCGKTRNICIFSPCCMFTDTTDYKIRNMGWKDHSTGWAHALHVGRPGLVLDKIWFSEHHQEWLLNIVRSRSWALMCVAHRQKGNYIKNFIFMILAFSSRILIDYSSCGFWYIFTELYTIQKNKF